MGGMNDLPPESRPVPPSNPDPTATQAMPADRSARQRSETPARQRLRDRLRSLRAVIAVALASVIIGGLGGAALASVSGHDDGRMGPGHGRFNRGGPGPTPTR
jgi:hypothetical protein